VAQRAFPISKKQEKAITPSGNSSEGENVDEIQSLTQRVSDLGQAVDFWNVVMLWGLALAAAAAIVIGVSTRLIVLRAGQQAESQGLLSEASNTLTELPMTAKSIAIASTSKENRLAISVGRLSLVGRPNITCVPKIRHTATKASPKNQIRTLPDRWGLVNGDSLSRNSPKLF
jgi:hypothetical protein